MFVMFLFDIVEQVEHLPCHETQPHSSCIPFFSLLIPASNAVHIMERGLISVTRLSFMHVMVEGGGMHFTAGVHNKTHSDNTNESIMRKLVLSFM